MHPGFCPICCNIFEQVDCVPCRITCGHVACQRCCDRLVKSRQCCPFRCDPAILRSRHIRPMAMSLVSAGGSPGGDLVKSKITTAWSTIRQEELKYNQVVSTLHALRVDIFAQRGALQMRAHRMRDALAGRYDLLRQLGRARKELEAEMVTEGCLRDELTLLKRNRREIASRSMIPLPSVAPCAPSPVSQNEADTSFIGISAAQGRKRRRDAREDDAEAAAYEARGRRRKDCPIATRK